MIELLDKVLEFFETLFGLAVEEGLTLLNRYVRFVKKISKYGGYAFLTSLICLIIGKYIPIFSSIAVWLAGGTAAVIALVLIPTYIAIEWAAEKFPSIQKAFERIYTILIGTAFFGIYIYVASKHDRIYPVIICIFGIFLVRTLIVGKNDQAAVFIFRLNVLLTVITVVMLGSTIVPHAFIERHRYGVDNLFGLEANQISYQVNTENELVDSNGQLIRFVRAQDGAPLVWYAYINGIYRLYSNEGFDHEGHKLLPITPEVVEKIKEEAQLKKRLTIIPTVEHKTERIPIREKAPLPKTEPPKQAEVVKPKEQELPAKPIAVLPITIPPVLPVTTKETPLILKVITRSGISTNNARPGDKVSAWIAESIVWEGIRLKAQNDTVDLQILSIFPANKNVEPLIEVRPIQIHVGREVFPVTNIMSVRITPGKGIARNGKHLQIPSSYPLEFTIETQSSQ